MIFIDLISIGDAVVDTYVPLTAVGTKLVDGHMDILLPLGNKIPVGSLTSLVGGNAANNAVGAARLSLKTAIYVNIGSDHDGLKIRDGLKDEGVSERYLVKDEKLQTNRSIVLDVNGERVILSHHQDWKYHLPDLEQSKFIYFTSLSPSFIDSNIVNELVQYLDRTHAKLIFNPGTFQIKAGIQRYPRLLSLTELLVVNLEEAKLILKEADKGKGGREIKQLLKGLCDLGPRMAVITDGREGSYGFDGEKFFKIGLFPGKLVETTGAGDAYASGVLAALFHGKELAEAMRWGAANGASVVEQVGPQAGLLTYHGMQEKLKENSKIIAKEI